MNRICLIFLVLFTVSVAQAEQQTIDSLNSIIERSIAAGKFDNELFETIDYVSNFYELSDPKSGIGFLEKLINNNVFAGKSQYYGMMYSWLGKYHRAMFSPENALIFLLLSEKFYNDVDDSLSIYSNYSEIGHIYYDYRQYNKAINYYIQSYQGFNTDINDTSKANIPKIIGLAQSLTNMGLAYERMGKNTKAVEEFELALEIRRKINDPLQINKAYRHLARNQGILKHHGKAFLYYDSIFIDRNIEKTTDPLQLTTNSMTKAEAYTERALLYVSMGEQNKAIEDIAEAEKLYSKTSNFTALVKSLEKFAQALSDKKYSSNAYQYLMKAYKISKDNSLIFNSMFIARKISDFYESSGNQAMAFKYLKEYRDMNDSLFRNYLMRSIENAELNIRMSEKVKTIEDLEKEARLIEAELSQRNLQLLLVILLATVFIVLTIFYVRQNSMRKNFAELLKEKNKDLTETNDKLVVSEKKLEQNNKELIKKNIQLEHLNNTKDKLFSVLSHDLRNAVGSFKNLSDLLHDNFPDLTENEKRDFVLMIQDSSKKLFLLLENLLTWSRSQRGLIHFSPAAHEIHKLIENNVELVREQVTTKKITIINDVDDDILAYFDYNMIDTVVRNLLSNAIKFTDSGGIVHISSSAITGQDDKICITIEDNGLGMDKKTLNRLFRITQQKSKKGTQGEQGSGLGLIICREFVEKNDGRIWAESALYEYTKFHFTLKLNDNNKKMSHPVESGSVQQVL